MGGQHLEEPFPRDLHAAGGAATVGAAADSLQSVVDSLQLDPIGFSKVHVIIRGRVGDRLVREIARVAHELVVDLRAGSGLATGDFVATLLEKPGKLGIEPS